MWASVPTTTSRAEILEKQFFVKSVLLAIFFVVVSDALVSKLSQWVFGRRPHIGRDLLHRHTIVVRFGVVKASFDQFESETSDIIFVRIYMGEATVHHVGTDGFKRHAALRRYWVPSVFDAICHRLLDLSVRLICIVRHYDDRPSLRTRQAVTTDSVVGELDYCGRGDSELAPWGSDDAAEA